MPELLTAAVFVLVATVTTVLSLWVWSQRSKALSRLSTRTGVVSDYLPSPSLVWQQLVDRVGSLVPSSPRGQPLLKRRLLRAGFRNPNAARTFQGARVVSTVLLGLASFLVAAHFYTDNVFLLVVAGGTAGFLLPMQVLQFRIRRRRHGIELGLPSVLDLMVVCMESGLGLDQTVLQVSHELRGPYPEICEEFAVLNLEMRAGKRRSEALHNLADRAGVEDLRKLVAVLVQTDRFGTSVARTLREHSDYMRAMARQRAEERAAKLAVKLVFPIFFCVLPSLFVVTVGPVLTRLARDLVPMIENL